MALYFGRDMLNVLKNTIFHDSLKSLFTKIKTTLPHEYTRFLDQFEKNIKLDLSEDSFKRPGNFSIEKHMESSFGVFHGEPVKIKIWFAPEAAVYIKEKTWHESQIITDQKDGSIHFEAEVAGSFEIKTWIMGWGAKAKVIEPKSLKNEILSEVDSLKILYAQ